MKRLTYLFAILLISSAVAWADETITVTATNSDISANLDLKVVAKLFGEAKDLEDFEKKLNDPEQALVNLDLNGDGDVDYIRVIETNNGNKHLIVLQAVLAKDIYQDVASIYVEKDEANNVSVQVIGDEYIYGTNYVIEPVYIYRPVIYDWFWGPYWTCWYSPWYWGYWPGWWRPYACIGYHDYHHRCHDFHHEHYGCSFHYAKEARPATHRMGEGVSRHDYATSHPEGSFATRHAGTEVSNARQLASPRQAAATRTDVSGASAAASTRTTAPSTTRSASPSTAGASTRGNTYGSSYSGAASTRTATPSVTRSATAATRTATPTTTRTATSATATRSDRSSATFTHPAASTTSYSGSGASTRSSYSGSSYSGSTGSSRSSYSGSTGSSRSSYSGSSSSSSYSGSSHRSGATVSAPASSRSAGGASTRR